MPVEFKARCARCKQEKLRNEFPSHVVGKDARGRVRMAIDPYCRECQTRYPGLLRRDAAVDRVPDR